jgi:hypothetical protein
MFLKILDLVPTETWQLVEANGASKVRFRDPTAISPTSFHIRRKTHHFAPYKKFNTLLHTAATYKPYKFRQLPPPRLIHSSTSSQLRSTIQHFAPYSDDIQIILVSPNTTTSIQTQFHELAATLHHRRTPTTLSRLCYSSPQGACTGFSPIWTRPICCTARNTLIGAEPSF